MRDVCLIVNPSAGGGRAARVLPLVEAALRARSVAFRVERTTSIEHARALARETLAAGEIAAAVGGDGLTGAVAGELRDDPRGLLALLPGGRGNDFARKLGIPGDPLAACDVLVEGVERPVDVADVGGRTYVGIASAGIDSDCQDVANATRLRLGGFVYLYGTLRALWSWRPARWELTVDGEHRAFTGYSVAVANSGMFGGGMRLAPGARLDDGLLDVVLIEDAPRRRYLRNLPRVFDGSHVEEPNVHVLTGREITFSADRPFTAYADGDPIAELPATIRVRPGALRVLVPRRRRVTLLGVKVAAANAVGTLARRVGRGGGTSLPGKVLMRAEPHAIGLLASRLEHGNVVVSATNGKTTTAAMIAAILERHGHRLVHNRAGANMAGGVASALAAASRHGGRALDGDLGLFEVDEFWLGPVTDELRPRALLLANLFRDQLDRYGELDTIADRWAGVVSARPPGTRLVLNADDPLVADLARAGARTDELSPPTATALDDPAALPLHFGVEDDAMAQAELQHASDSKHCRRCGHAYVYEVAYLGHLGRYHCPNCGARRPRPAIAARAVELKGIRAAAFTLDTPAGERRVELPLPGLYNVYNALAAAALTLSLGVDLDTVVAGLAAVEPAFGRAETLVLGGRPTSILLVKNPAGANEVLRTLSLEGSELDLFGVLNDRIADGRDVSWVWDADWELLAPHVRRMTCSGTRAAELALRLKYAGVDPARLHVVDALPDGLDAALAASPAPEPLYAVPTYTAMLELQALLTERGATQDFWR